MSLFPRLKKNNQGIITNNPGLQRFLFILAFFIVFLRIVFKTDKNN